MERIVTGGHGVLNLEKASSSRPGPMTGLGGIRRTLRFRLVGLTQLLGKRPKRARRRLVGSRKESVSTMVSQDIGRETVQTT